MGYFDQTWLIIVPGLLLSMWAQAMVSGAFRKYSKIGAQCSLTGSQLAEKLLRENGMGEVSVVRIPGTLTDNFDPDQMTLSLSGDVYDARTIAALSVAAHECGHVMQKRDHYAPMNLRSFIVPSVNLGSNLSWPIFLAGIVFSFRPLQLVGIALFAITVLFTLVTLPVEFNASARALRMLESTNTLDADEMGGARKVLRAAALTYVASALSAMLQLARLLLISNRRRD